MQNEIVDPDLQEANLWSRFLLLRVSYQRAAVREIKITLIGAFISSTLMFAMGLICGQKEQLSSLELLFLFFGHFAIEAFVNYFDHGFHQHYIPAAQSICLKFELIKLSANIFLFSTGLVLLASLSKNNSPSYNNNKLSKTVGFNWSWSDSRKKKFHRFEIIVFLIFMVMTSLVRATEIILVLITSRVE